MSDFLLLTLIEHAKEEEEDILPALQRCVTMEEAEKLGREFESIKVGASGAVAF